MFRSNLKVVALAAAVTVGPLAWRESVAGAVAAVERPSVIVVLADDQGYGDLSCHGNPVLKTPNLDKLHSESIRLTDFHVTPMCTPTRGQIMTGQDTLRNGAFCVCSGRTFIRPGTATMAEIFAAGGYRTGIFGKWHLGDNYPHRPLDRGFQEAVYHLGWGITSTPDYWNNDYFDDFFRHNGRLQRYPGYCTDVWFAEAANWIKACRQRNEPFFVYLTPNAPHAPFFVPEKYRRPYKNLDPQVASFFGMIANLDENMAKLDAMLQQTGLRDDVILIFMTDNGGTGGIKVYNAGMRGAKTSLYDGGHRVPCFIRWPRGPLRRPGDVDTLTQCQDLLPTLIDFCGLKPPAGAHFDGTSLAALLQGKPQPGLSRRMLVVQYGGLEHSDPDKWDSAVLWNQWRLVKGRELYDIQADPGQQSDVAARHADVVKQMRDHYEKWWAGIEPRLADFTPITVGSEQENPTCLTSMDWLAPKLVVAAQDHDVRQLGQQEVHEASLPLGRPTVLLNGPWNILVQRDGQYEISLRRWPQEADAPIAGGLPPLKCTDGEFPAGKALPIVKARLQVGDTEQAKLVAKSDKAVTFTVRLAKGKTMLQTWFYDAAGKDLCGAFYVYVERK